MLCPLRTNRRDDECSNGREPRPQHHAGKPLLAGDQRPRQPAQPPRSRAQILARARFSRTLARTHHLLPRHEPFYFILFIYLFWHLPKFTK